LCAKVANAMRKLGEETGQNNLREHEMRPETGFLKTKKRAGDHGQWLKSGIKTGCN